MTSVLALGRPTTDSPREEQTDISKYKYGSVAQSRRFALRLTDLALRAFPNIVTRPVTITAPGSRAVPISADPLANHVLAFLNHRRAQAGTEPAQRAKLHRHVIPAGDYGNLDAAGRAAVLSQEHVTTNADQINGRAVIVVDDLWVTGASADVTIRTLTTYQPASLTYLVIGQVPSDFVAVHKTVEFDLNHAYCKNLAVIGDMIRREPVVITQRLCKFVLSEKNPQALQAFIANLPLLFAQNLRNAILSEGLGVLPTYRENALVINEMVKSAALQRT